MNPFDTAAAKRYALLALEVENDNTGYEQGYITRRPRTVPEEARWLVDSWFADLHGWPLNGRERHQRDTFLAVVLDQIKEMRP